MSLFTPHNKSPMARWSAGLKMSLGFSMSLWVVLVDSLPALSAAALAGLVVFLLARPNRSQWKLVLVSTLLVVWGLLLSQALFYQRYPRHALVVLLEPNWFFEDGLRIYAEGIRHGLVQSLRITAVGLVSYAICFSTQPDQFLRGLLGLGVPFSLAFMATSAIRFLPVVAGEFRTVRTAMRLKGYRPFRRGLVDTIRTEIASLRPVLAGSIRRSQEVALSILVRGFSPEAPRSSLLEQRAPRGERLAAAALILLVAAVAVCKILFLLYVYEIYYAPQLRPLYALVRHWL